MKAPRFILVLVALLSPWQQARGFHHPPCNVRRSPYELQSGRQVHDEGVFVVLLCQLPPPLLPRTRDPQCAAELLFPEPRV